MLGFVLAKPFSEPTAVTQATITRYEREDLPDNGWHF